MQPLPGAEEGSLGAGADSEVDWEAESGPADDGRTVYTLLSRPLPPYALEHFFSRHGKVPEHCSASTGFRSLSSTRHLEQGQCTNSRGTCIHHLTAFADLAEETHRFWQQNVLNTLCYTLQVQKACTRPVSGKHAMCV